MPVSLGSSLQNKSIEDLCKIVTSNPDPNTFLALCHKTLSLITTQLPLQIIRNNKTEFEEIDYNCGRYNDIIQNVSSVVTLNQFQCETLYDNIMSCLSIHMTTNFMFTNDEYEIGTINAKYVSNYRFNFHSLLKLLDKRFFKNELRRKIKVSIMNTDKVCYINNTSCYDEVYHSKVSKQEISI